MSICYRPWDQSEFDLLCYHATYSTLGKKALTHVPTTALYYSAQLQFEFEIYHTAVYQHYKANLSVNPS